MHAGVDRTFHFIMNINIDNPHHQTLMSNGFMSPFAQFIEIPPQSAALHSTRCVCPPLFT